MKAKDGAERSVHLMLVDDDRLILAMLGTGLVGEGYQVSTAESHEEAEALLQGGTSPDLVVLDVQLPDGSGLALAERLRDLDRIPFIMLSAYSDSETVGTATELGALGYLVKPVDIARMVPTIEAALKRATELRQLRDNGDKLQAALQSDRDVSVAVGIVMVQYRMDRDAAFDLLRTAARNQRRKLVDVAEEVIRTASTLHTK